MTGRPPRHRLGSGPLPDPLFQAFPNPPYWPSCTGGVGQPRTTLPPCPSQYRPHTNNNKAADPVQESAATIAAAGMPPEPHEREAVIVARPRPLGHRADRMALYEVIRHAGPHALCAVPLSERDARLGRLRCAGLSYSMSTGRENAASLLSYERCIWSAWLNSGVCSRIAR